MPDIFVSPSSAPSSPSSSSTAAGSTRSGNTLSHALSAYLFNPLGIRFETQQSDEHIILLLRKHWITNFSWVTVSLLLLATPVILFPFIVQNKILAPEFPVSIVNFL